MQADMVDDTEHPGTDKFVVAEIVIEGRVVIVGIPVAGVREVVAPSSVEKLPTNCHPFVGLISVRKRPIPVLAISDNERENVAIGRVLVCEVGNAEIGLAVQGTCGVQTLLLEEHALPTASVAGLNLPFPSKTVLHVDGRYIHILALESLVPAELAS